MFAKSLIKSSTMRAIARSTIRKFSDAASESFKKEVKDDLKMFIQSHQKSTESSIKQIQKSTEAALKMQFSFMTAGFVAMGAVIKFEYDNIEKRMASFEKRMADFEDRMAKIESLLESIKAKQSSKWWG